MCRARRGFEVSDLQQTIFGQAEIVGCRHQRMADDYYPTPEGITRALIDRVVISGTIFECCAGHGAIADVLASTERIILQSDLSWPSPNGELRDAIEPRFWESWTLPSSGGIPVDWTVTNPPFCEAEQILPLAWEHSRRGYAFLLRLSYLEPTAGRADWLNVTADHLRHLIPVNPRPKFRRDVGGTDSVTAAWFVWEKNWSWQDKGIQCPCLFVSGWQQFSDSL